MTGIPLNFSFPKGVEVGWIPPEYFLCYISQMVTQAFASVDLPQLLYIPLRVPASVEMQRSTSEVHRLVMEGCYLTDSPAVHCWKLLAVVLMPIYMVLCLVLWKHPC